MNTCIRWTGLVLALLLAGCASMSGPDPASFRGAIDSPIRTDQDRVNDVRRKPDQFLAFAGVRPGMRALDVSAGGGYTSQLLALAVGPQGRVWAQVAAPRPALEERVQKHPQPHYVPVVRPLEDPAPPEAQGTLDLVTLILNYHDITYLPVDRAKMNAAILRALKPGGSFVVVDHSGRPGTGASEAKTLHRIEEAFVRQEIERAGFRLAASTDYARNPQDTRELTTSGAKFSSDRFVLRFEKPR